MEKFTPEEVQVLIDLAKMITPTYDQRVFQDVLLEKLNALLPESKEVKK